LASLRSHRLTSGSGIKLGCNRRKSEEAVLAAMHHHIRKCREASSIFRERKSGQKIEKTINFQEGGIGGIVPPDPEVQGGIRRFARGKKWQID